MNDKSDVLGMEVLVITDSGDERLGFVAFCDDSKGLTIKNIKTQEDILCHDIKLWDLRRKIARRCNVPMLYRNNGEYTYEYLKSCIRQGFMWGVFVQSDLRNHKSDACGELASCPSGL